MTKVCAIMICNIIKHYSVSFRVSFFVCMFIIFRFSLEFSFDHAFLIPSYQLLFLINFACNRWSPLAVTDFITERVHLSTWPLFFHGQSSLVFPHNELFICITTPIFACNQPSQWAILSRYRLSPWPWSLHPTTNQCDQYFSVIVYRVIPYVKMF